MTPGGRGAVVITGASAGVGRATALAFARAGRPVGLVARGRSGLQAAAEEIEAAGGRAVVAPADVADYAQVEAAAGAVEDALGPVEVWVNNAMTTVFAPLTEVSPEEFRRGTEVTYLGAVHGTMAALRRMRPRRRGVIVMVGSALAHRGIPLQSCYCGAKHALQGFFESLRCELLHEGSGVRVVMVHLPGLNTPQFGWCLTRLPRKPRPVAPVYQPEVAARAIVYAADHPGRRELWVGGSTVATILADRVAPRLVDRYLAATNYDAQQRPEPVEAGRRANLWEPVDEDRGAHGDFDSEAHPRSLQAELARRPGVLAGLLGIGGLLLAARRARR